MSNQTDDDDDDFALERDIAREIEEAFADVPYPGDDKLVDNPDLYGRDMIIEAFRGKHWKEITIDVLYWHRDSIGLFSPEGFRFYLPCFMIGALLHIGETDTLWQSVFFDLTPRELEGPRRDWFDAWVRLLDVRQKAAVRRYVEVYVQNERSFPDPDKDRALAFWRRITEPANPLLNDPA
jgi:hypothetical protein